MNLLTTAHHSDAVKNVVTGSTIIFFDEDDQIDSTSTSIKIQPTAPVGSAESTSKPENTVIQSTGVEIQNDEPDKATNSQNNSDDSDLSTASTSNHDDSTDTDGGDTSEVNDGAPGRPVSGGLLSLGSLGINGLSALGPVITAMAGLLQGKPSTNRRNDTITPPPAVHQEPQDVTSQRSPIYIPVADFADGDIETAESQNIAAQLANPNYVPETRHKVAVSLVDGIPISPGEIITANSDVIIGRPGILSPRPPQTYHHNENENQNIGMKPPPISVPNIAVHPVLEVIRDDSVPEPTRQIQHIVSVESSNRPQKNPHLLNKEPPARTGSKHDVLENDPLLKPPGRPNIEKYANPNINPKEPEWISDRFRRPWSSKDPLMPPPVPPTPSRIDQGPNLYVPESKPWPNRPQDDQKRSPWAQRDPINSDDHLKNPEKNPESTEASEPIIHQVPHVIDRSTGQPLLVNIQPSQVANVVIPQGGTQALIFGDTNEPHISGQYFDDPSPYPDPEVGPSFGQFENHENDPTDYMKPPAPPAINLKPHPHTIPISNSRIYARYPPRPHDNIEISTNPRPEKRPSDVLLIQRPDAHAQSTQGQVHTEILVHHSTDTNIHMHNRPTLNQQQSFVPPRRDYHKPAGSNDQIPPRRTVDISPSIETPHHRYGYHQDNKPNRTLANEVLKQKWKNNRTKQRITVIRPRPLLHTRPTHYPHSDRVPGYAGGKVRYPLHRPSPPSHIHQAPHLPQISVNWKEETKVDRPPGITYLQGGQESQENLPSGAVGYKNPLIANTKRPIISPTLQPTNYQPSSPQNHQVHQLPPDISPPEIQSFGQILPRPDEPDSSWSETQTEAGPDSAAEESEENVKYHDEISHHHEEHEDAPHESQFNDKHNHDESIQSTAIETSQTEKPDDVGAINTIISQSDDDDQDNSTDDVPDLPENNQDNPTLNIDNQYEQYEDIIEDMPKQNENNQTENLDYEVVEGIPFGMKVQETDTKPEQPDDTKDLMTTTIIPHYIPEKPIRTRLPADKIRPNTRPRPDHNEHRPEVTDISPPGGHARPPMDWGTPDKQDNAEYNKPYNRRNLTLTQPIFSHDTRIQTNTKYVDTAMIRTPSANGGIQQNGSTRPHLTYPHILTKPRPAVPRPITISSGSQTKLKRPTLNDNHKDTSAQTERPGMTMRPSLIIHTKDKNRESLETAYQTNFALNDNEESAKRPQLMQDNSEVPSVPSRNMMPPPPTNAPIDKISNDDAEGDLQPPPMPSDVVGMSPPPVAITTTTTGKPIIITADDTGLRPPPPKYIPLTDSAQVVGETPPPPPALSQPSVNMVPPTIPRPTNSRPFLMELLSQDMVPPRPPIIESSRPIQITTVRPAIAVSGSIQIATAVAASHIPVMQDMADSTIPIIHGTVDLPIVMDVSDILKSMETKKLEHVSVYTVRPFETRQREVSR